MTTHKGWIGITGYILTLRWWFDGQSRIAYKTTMERTRHLIQTVQKPYRKDNTLFVSQVHWVYLNARAAFSSANEIQSDVRWHNLSAFPEPTSNYCWTLLMIWHSKGEGWFSFGCSLELRGKKRVENWPLGTNHFWVVKLDGSERLINYLLVCVCVVVQGALTSHSKNAFGFEPAESVPPMVSSWYSRLRNRPQTYGEFKFGL